MKKLFYVAALLLNGAAAFASGHVATASYTSPTCYGACNGTASAMASGGVGPYGFTWTGPSSYTGSGASLSGLCAGTYVVTAIDSSDMSTATYTLNIIQPAVLTATISGPSSISVCAGVCANLNSSTSGGTGPYTYSWSPSTGLSASNISNPTACPSATTTYTLTVTDNNFCLANAIVTIYVNPNPVITVSSTNASCGLCTGTATVSGALTYAWSSGATGVHPTNLCAGTYTVTGCSGSGCCSTGTTTVINTSSSPVVTISSVIPATCGACNGSATANVSGGSPPYNYTWTPGGVTVPTASGLCAGNYTVSATDGAGCTGAASTIIGSSAVITNLTFTTTNSTCGAATGSISVTGVTGGVSPYTYSFNGGAFTSTTVYPGLAGGSYPLTVKDANGCTYSVSAIVMNSGAPTAVSITTVSSNCSSPSGEINIGAVTGGTSPFVYSVNGSSFSATVNYTALAPGTYPVVVKDANGCTLSQSATVLPSNPPILGTISITGVSCSSSPSGSVITSISSGTPPYSYLWAPGGATTQNISGISSPGNYTLTVTDAAGCSAIHVYPVPSASTLYAGLSSTLGNCGSLATLSAIPYGGTPPYTYMWSPGGQTTSTAVSLSSGLYHCTITDSMGCITGVNGNAFNSCYNLIKGKVYNDANANCVYDAGDSPIAGRAVWISGGGSSGYGYTDAIGNYTIYTTGMNNTVTHSSPLYSTVLCPAGNTQNVNFTTMGDTIYNVNFADQYTAGINDLTVNYYPGTARPGFQQSGVILYKNVGTTTISGVSIDLSLDSILQYNNAIPSASSYTYPTASWNIGTLAPGQTGYIYVFDSVPTIVDGGYIGRVLHYAVQINPVTGDNTPGDNYSGPGSTITIPPVAVVVAAWDPNAKEVVPSGDILAADSVLYYTIQFQNTGTDTAFTIVLKDTLSPYLDPAIVVPGAASHPYSFDISFGGELTWTFNNILLVDSNRNEPASHGFATFTVRQRSNNVVGTQISNTASIYFDFNEAVVTNTTVNTIVDVTTGIETSSTNNIIKVYPNPFSESTTFVISSDKLSETYSFELTDVLGKKVRNIKTNEKQFSVSRAGLENGIYFYKIYTAGSTVGIGKLVIE
jgi:hypothetical protein